MAGEVGLFKFMKPRRRLHTTDIQAAALWGVAGGTAALWIVQVNKTPISLPILDLRLFALLLFELDRPFLVRRNN